jgi:hypothetical protein
VILLSRAGRAGCISLDPIQRYDIAPLTPQSITAGVRNDGRNYRARTMLEPLPPAVMPESSLSRLSSGRKFPIQRR